ncbi:L-threonylcarbamoyladenylate synthase [Jeotgalibacillus campisalis]|uniref:Threonylcarbamoyl-AMP synthase n=1 Tax=Jeotgalibacillus campisalis TaxID=220754 RepID=A0A0C2V2N7_9BACL|nr:L-threonylcarbamoyladenylate synthase [Jeotgalibacillus campisalis]KIL43317.1 tRNA threonylcarbamoyladenosine biosynthesis protein [Jeotgalibacillus campisalis]
MITTMWIVDKNVDKNKDYPQIKKAAQLLHDGHTIAFPTETVYGLGADATSDQAVSGIFKAKGRPSDNPLIVHIYSTNQLSELVQYVDNTSQALIEQFWPGPLTLIFTKKQGVFSDKVTAGLDTVGIRMPDHPVALALMEACQKPIAAPSANRSGKPSPTSAAHVYYDLNGRIAGIVDGGETGVGVESTVLDCTVTPPMILRPGGISYEQLTDCIGPVDVDPSLEEHAGQPRSPGMKYTHYAPVAPLYVTKGSDLWLQETIVAFQQDGKKVGLLAPVETISHMQADFLVACGREDDLSTTAHSLYESIRAFDNEAVDIILAQSVEMRGIGVAIMNRLVKAAGHKWLIENNDKTSF